MSDSTKGIYTCRVTVKGYKEITSKAEVYMKGPAKIKDETERIQTGRIGQEARVTCDSFAIPLPDEDIVWAFNKIRIGKGLP